MISNQLSVGKKIQFFLLSESAKILYKFHKFVQKWESLRYSIFFKNPIDKKFSTGKVFRFTLKKPWFCLEKRYFYTVTTKFSTDRGENKKKADRFLSDIQSAQK